MEPDFGLTHLKSDATAYLGALTGKALPILLPADVWDISAEATTLTRQWVVAMTRVRSGSGIPNYAVFGRIGDACPDHNWMTVERYKVRQKSANGKLAVVEQMCKKSANSPAPVYSDPDADPPQEGAPGFTVDPNQKPPDELVLQGAVQQLDIRHHHLFSTANAAWGNLAMADFWDAERGGFNFNIDPTPGNSTAIKDLNGLEYFLVGGLTVRSRVYFLSEPPAADFYAALGTFSVPPGVAYTGPKKNWMVMSGTREELNGIWSVELIYLYSEKAWPPWLEAGGSY